MPFTVRRALAAAALAAVMAQPAFATEISASAVRAMAAAPAHQVASAQAHSPVVEAHLMDTVIAFIKHIIAQDGGTGGTDGTIHRG
jgi:hypothetical protein